MSWTGTESKRREQGGVAIAPVEPPAFRIRTGSPIRYRQLGEPRWHEHTTWRTADFDDGEEYGAGYWIFADREREYLVESRYIDFYGPSAPLKRRYFCPSTGRRRTAVRRRKAAASDKGRHK